jgi:hypothetical protein
VHRSGTSSEDEIIPGVGKFSCQEDTRISILFLLIDRPRASYSQSTPLDDHFAFLFKFRQNGQSYPPRHRCIRCLHLNCLSPKRRKLFRHNRLLRQPIAAFIIHRCHSKQLQHLLHRNTHHTNNHRNTKPHLQRPAHIFMFLHNWTRRIAHRRPETPTPRSTTPRCRSGSTATRTCTQPMRITASR